MRDWTPPAPQPDFIEYYNTMLECLIRLNIIHPGCNARLEDPENQDHNPVNDDWVNRIVKRVVTLRMTQEDEGATAIIDKGVYRNDHSLFYRCVCLRSDGTKEKPDGEVIIE